VTGKFYDRLILSIVVTVAALFILFYGNKQVGFHGDALGYYTYLPTTFIYHNYKDIASLPNDKQISPFVMQSVGNMAKQQKTPLGYVTDQYTYGVALLELPFFCIAHLYEKANGLPANGYSNTYCYLIKFGSFLYGILGLIVVYRILKQYFSRTLSLLCIALLFLGTNLLWFTLYQAGMSHVPLFFLYALMMFFTIKVYKIPKWNYFIALGFISGLITVVRPTDIICLFIPLLYNVYDKNSIIEKLNFLKRNYGKIFVAGIFFVLPILPQLIYWKVLSGSFLYDSYGPNQTFYWLHPKIRCGLFYYANGWLPYSPIMIFSLAGMLVYRYFKQWAWCLWVMFPIYVYVIYSWYCYNYINGLGSRPMIHLYPILALSLTAFIRYISEKGWLAKVSFALVSVFFIALNISYSMQEAKGLLNSEYSNFYYNYQTLFRMHLTYNDLVVNDNGQIQPDTNKIHKIATLGCENFEDSVSDRYVKDPIKKQGYVYHMLNEEFMPNNAVSLVYNKQKFKGGKWLKASGMFMCPGEYLEYFRHLLVVSIGPEDKFLDYRKCAIESKIGISDNSCAHKDLLLSHYELNKWGKVYFFVKIPSDIQDGDAIKLFIWNIGHREMYMDDVCLELYD
jgi:hypothetical protein